MDDDGNATVSSRDESSGGEIQVATTCVLSSRGNSGPRSAAEEERAHEHERRAPERGH